VASIDFQVGHATLRQSATADQSTLDAVRNNANFLELRKAKLVDFAGDQVRLVFIQSSKKFVCLSTC